MIILLSCKNDEIYLEKKEIRNGYLVFDFEDSEDKEVNLKKVFKLYNEDEKSQIQNLIIKNCKINEMKEIDGLKKLEFLSVSRSNLEKIPKISSNLYALLIRESKIEKIENVSNSNLESLNLRKNNITSIEGLSKLKNLESLNLTDNNISKIENLDDLSNLKKLLLFKCRISKIENLNGLNNLEEINLSWNNIKKIENLFELNKLQTLTLANNKIEKIEGLDKVINLTGLALQFNNISKIENLSMLKKLNIFDLGNNKITKIENLEELTKLSQLSLKNNKIEVVKGISKNTNLQFIDLSGNPITSITRIDYDFLMKRNGYGLLDFIKDGIENGSIKVIKDGEDADISKNNNQYYRSTIDNLRFRESPDLDGEFIRMLTQSDKLELLEKGKSEIINDITGTWVKVKTEQGEIGWCFDAYLEEIK